MNEEQQRLKVTVNTSSKLGPTAASANESLSTFHHHDIDIPAIHLRHFCPASSPRATYDLSRTCYIN
jgi:hypothetical protein